MPLHGRFDHVSVVVDDLRTSAKFYKDFLGFKEVLRADNKSRGVKIMFLKKGSKTVELTKWSDERQKGLNHICFEVDDLKSELGRVRKKGYEVTLPYLKTPMGWELAFFKGPDNVLVELLERGKKRRKATG